MIKTTLKEIKNTNAHDITYLSFKDMDNLLNAEGGLNEIAYSVGLYGCNGVILQGYKSGMMYKITSRTTALFMI